MSDLLRVYRDSGLLLFPGSVVVLLFAHMFGYRLCGRVAAVQLITSLALLSVAWWLAGHPLQLSPDAPTPLRYQYAGIAPVVLQAALGLGLAVTIWTEHRRKTRPHLISRTTPERPTPRPRQSRPTAGPAREERMTSTRVFFDLNECSGVTSETPS